VNVGTEAHVVGEIPAIVVGVFVDDDVVAVPEPVTTVVQIKRSDAKEEAAKPEAARTTSPEAPTVAAAEAAGEAAVLPGVIEVEAAIIAAEIVSHPLAVAVDVRGFGMTFAVAERRMGFGLARRAMKGLGTMVGDVSTPDLMAAAVLRKDG